MGDLCLMKSQAAAMQSLAQCMQQSWMCILVGPSGSGMLLIPCSQHCQCLAAPHEACFVSALFSCLCECHPMDAQSSHCLCKPEWGRVSICEHAVQQQSVGHAVLSIADMMVDKNGHPIHTSPLDIPKTKSCKRLLENSAGKISVARALAGLAGQELVELALNGGTDTSDLLGGFEQLEPSRRLQVGFPVPPEKRIVFPRMRAAYAVSWCICQDALIPA